MTPSIVIAGGGTAGHVYPGLALAEALRSASPDARISFVGTARGIETTAVPAAGFELHEISVIPWSSSLGAKRFLAPVSLSGAVRASWRILKREQANAVVGMGGYASMPVVIAARGAHIASLLHEQNTIPGIANVIGSRFTRNVALSFEEARDHFPSRSRIRVVGNPIRRALAAVDREVLRPEARSALGFRPGSRVVVVFGGSLGAARLNEAVVGLAQPWSKLHDVEVLLVTGPKHVDEISRVLPAGGVVRAAAYIDRMEYAYAAADLIVARAGAATIAELAATGTPSLLVPYPYARGDHQTANARTLVNAGGAVLVSDADATTETIGRLAEELLADPARLRTMGERAKSFGKPRAATDLAGWVLEMAGVKS